GLQHCSIASLLQHLAHEPVDTGEGEFDNHRAVVVLLLHGPLLTDPARPLARDPDACAARRGDLARSRPAVHVGDGINVCAGLEAAAGGSSGFDAIEAKVAYVFAAHVVAGH